MKKINLITALAAAVLSVLCTGCPNDTADQNGTTTTTIAYHKFDPLPVSDIESSLDNLSDDVKGVELTVSEADPDLSQLREIIRNHGDINIKLDLSQCSDMASIKSKVFDGCGNLTSITIPDSVTSIEISAFEGAFDGCVGLTSINVGAGNTVYCSVDGVLFNKDKTELIQCPSGKKGTYTIPDGVTSIGDGAFYECCSLTRVTIPDSVTSIGMVAFRGCSGLTVKINAETPPTVGSFVFDSSPESVFIIVPSELLDKYKETDGWEGYSSNIYTEKDIRTGFVIEGTTLIGLYDKTMTDVIIPDGVTSIGQYAFYLCSRLTRVTIPSSVTSIGQSAFEGCSGLMSVTIGSGVTSIGQSAFEGCSRLTKVNYKGTIAQWCGILFINDISNPLYYGITNPLYYAHNLYISGKLVEGDLVIPDGVTSIGQYAFYKCHSLTSITIPDSVTSIGDGAFYNCDKLTSVTIGSGVTSIGDGAFYRCDSLVNVSIHGSVKSIGKYAFYRCSSLTNVTMLEDTSIGIGAFYGCSGLIGYDAGPHSYTADVTVIVKDVPSNVKAVSIWCNANNWMPEEVNGSSEYIADVIDGTAVFKLQNYFVIVPLLFQFTPMLSADTKMYDDWWSYAISGSSSYANDKNNMKCDFANGTTITLDKASYGAAYWKNNSFPIYGVSSSRWCNEKWKTCFANTP